MEADRLKWDERYLTKPENNTPDSFLQENIGFLRRPRLLDIAGGYGRNALFLASKGFEVTLADISEVGFQKLASNPRSADLKIKPLRIDLDFPEALRFEKAFNSIVCINFRLQSELLKLIPDRMNQDDIFFWCSFNELQALETGFPIDKSLKPNEFIEYFTELTLIHHQRFEDQTGKRDGYIFRKN
ncbi:MAG: hypothetical protein HOO86_11040 [Bacteroidales bacterium]|nr:hypothetical protein [Bacteroidales bacterium]